MIPLNKSLASQKPLSINRIIDINYVRHCVVILLTFIFGSSDYLYLKVTSSLKIYNIKSFRYHCGRLIIFYLWYQANTEGASDDLQSKCSRHLQ